MIPRRIGVLIGVTAVAAAGLGVGIGLAASGPGSPAQAPTGTTAAASYSWYRSMMGRHYGGTPMMGGTGGYGWMMGSAGYRWMLGGAAAPRWMRGARLPAAMMGTGTDPGQLMGRLWASAPGPRVSPLAAARDASQAPAGARVDRAARTITFTTSTDRLIAVASPPGHPDETFSIAGLTDPAITVPAGARVSIEVINADPGTAHGLVITASHDPSSPMPMMTSRPAFASSAAWFLGDPTKAGMHAATFTFTATTPGSYRYLCPVPGHAQNGMTGTFIVAG